MFFFWATRAVAYYYFFDLTHAYFEKAKSGRTLQKGRGNMSGQKNQK